MRDYPGNMFRLCIDGTQELQGQVYTPLRKDPIPFVGVEVVLELDKLFDATGFPQSFQDKRSFDEDSNKGNAYQGKPQLVLSQKEIESHYGKKATFDCFVKTRANASWQGTLYNIKGEEIGEFNGDVELLSLLEKNI